VAQLLKKEILRGDVDYTSAELESLRELLLRPTEDVAFSQESSTDGIISYIKMSDFLYI